MWYLYLDESGDLGFDFVNKKPSKFFTVSILKEKSRVYNFIARQVIDQIPLEKNKIYRMV